MKGVLRALSVFPLSLPLAFEPAPEAGRFVARQGGARIEVACTGIEVAWSAHETPVRIRFAGSERPALRAESKGPALRAVAEDPTLRAASEDPALLAVASDPQPGRVSYLIGRDPARWRRGVPRFGRVTCPALRPGIDVAIYGREGQLEFDVIAAPGADLAAFELALEGVEAQTLLPGGDLALRAGARRLVLKRPVAYQESEDGVRRAVESRFARRGPARLGFALGAFDPGAPLVIDPVLELSTYAGGNRFDAARAVAVAPDGSVLVAGISESNDFPTTGGAFQEEYAGANDEFERGDAFVMKLLPGGADLVWATYLGGRDPDAAAAVAVGPGGDVFVAGSTASKDFPATPGAFQPERDKIVDAFVARLGPDGDTLEYATFLGGKDGDSASALAVDAAGNATVAGSTFSKDFPVTPGVLQPRRRNRQDAFVARLAPMGDALLWSTFLGGEEFEAARGVALTADGGAVVVGGTSSNQFPTTLGALQPAYASDNDAFVSKLAADGTRLVWSTFLGGKDGNPLAYDAANAVALDAYESVYVVGETLSRDLPVSAGAFDPDCGRDDDCQLLDAFAVKLSADGCAAVYGTYLGDGDSDAAYGVAVDARGHAHVTGFTRDEDFPVTLDAAQPEKKGGPDAFLSELDAEGGALVYSSFLGSSDPDAGFGVALGGALRAHVVGSANGNDFEIAGTAFQPDKAGTTDAFLAVFGGAPADEPALLAGLALPEPAALGATAPAALRVRNAGSVTASNVSASVTLDAALALSAPAPSQGACAFVAPTLTCALGGLAPGAEAVVDFDVTPNAAGVLAGSAAIAADGGESARAAACLLAQINDFAVLSVKAPKSVRVPAGGSTSKKVTVEIENMGNHPERIGDLATLEALVSLELAPTGMACAPAAVALDPKAGKKLPLELEPGKKLKVPFVATFDCADTDYVAEATLDHTALDGLADSDPTDDVLGGILIDAVPK